MKNESLFGLCDLEKGENEFHIIHVDVKQNKVYFDEDDDDDENEKDQKDQKGIISSGEEMKMKMNEVDIGNHEFEIQSVSNKMLLERILEMELYLNGIIVKIFFI